MNTTEKTLRIVPNLTFKLSSFGLAVEEYLTDCRVRNLAKRTITRYAQVLAEFAEYLPGIELADITASDIRHYLTSLEDSGHNAGGVALHYRHLKAFFRWLYVEDILTVDLFKRIKTPRTKNEPLPPAELADINSLLKVASGKSWTDIRDKAIILTLLDTGIRANELCGLDVADVDLQTGAVHIRADVAKGGKPRDTFAGPKTRRAILAYLRGHKVKAEQAPLFTKADGERLKYSGLRAIVTRRCELAQIQPLPLHSFRRAFAVNALRNGIDLMRLKDLMGHASIVTTQRYLKFCTEDLREAHEAASPVRRLKG